MRFLFIFFHTKRHAHVLLVVSKTIFLHTPHTRTRNRSAQKNRVVKLNEKGKKKEKKGKGKE